MTKQLEERTRLIERATDCFLKFNSALSLSMLESIEAKAINRSEDRTMERIKLGREGWLEEGMEKGIEKGLVEVALRLLEKGVSIEEVCDVTKLSRSKVIKLAKKQKRPSRTKTRDIDRLSHAQGRTKLSG